MSEQVNSEQRGCRNCGGTAFHSVLCDLCRGDGSVLDSERRPERHEVLGCMTCGAEVVRLKSGTLVHVIQQADWHDPVVRDQAPQPQPEAACVECGHELRFFDGEQCNFIVDTASDKACGHKCPAPEAPAVAETCLAISETANETLDRLLEYIENARPSNYAPWRDFEKREMARMIPSSPAVADDKLINSIVEAVWHCVDYDETGGAWLDNLKAKTRVRRLLPSSPAQDKVRSL